MKSYSVVFHTDTNYNGQLEKIEAENKGEVKAKLHEKYGKVHIMYCYEVK